MHTSCISYSDCGSVAALKYNQISTVSHWFCYNRQILCRFNHSITECSHSYAWGTIQDATSTRTSVIRSESHYCTLCSEVSTWVYTTIMSAYNSRARSQSCLLTSINFVIVSLTRCPTFPLYLKLSWPTVVVCL